MKTLIFSYIIVAGLLFSNNANAQVDASHLLGCNITVTIDFGTPGCGVIPTFMQGGDVFQIGSGCGPAISITVDDGSGPQVLTLPSTGPISLCGGTYNYFADPNTLSLW